MRIARELARVRKAAAMTARAAEVVSQFFELRRASPQRFRLRWRDRWLMLFDATRETAFDRHYVFHTAWAARILATARPAEHVDVASSLFFVVNVSAFVPIRFIDYRPADLQLPGVTTEQGDLRRLHLADRSVSSLSCMHVLEHVGLGRYGDSLEYDGDVRAARELMRVLAPGGTLLLVVPVGGTATIQFNAHRIYTYAQVLEMFSELRLREFALVPDSTDAPLVRHASEELANAQRYGCGCFHFERAAS